MSKHRKLTTRQREQRLEKLTRGLSIDEINRTFGPGARPKIRSARAAALTPPPGTSQAEVIRGSELGGKRRRK